jgi:hypothetical protein
MRAREQMTITHVLLPRQFSRVGEETANVVKKEALTSRAAGKHSQAGWTRIWSCER